MWSTIKRRLKEPTTWGGIAILATVLGVPTEQIGIFNQIVAALSAILGISLPENAG